MRTAPQILIVDDHPLFRDALEQALRTAFPDGAVCDKASNMAGAFSSLTETPADLVLLDLNLPDASGFEGLQVLRARWPDTRLLVVSATETPEAYRKARSLGASGYIPKSLDLEEMAAALVTVLDGGDWFPESASTSSADNETARVASLTPAQRRVLSGLADGLLNKQIAHEMNISTATVKAHMTAIFRKLGANNRTQALLIFQSATSLSDHSAA